MLSHDGQSVAYSASNGATFATHIDGTRLDDGVSWTWPAAKRIRIRNRDLTMLDGAAMTPVGEPRHFIVSADGETYAYVGSRDGDVVVVNGTPHKQFGAVALYDERTSPIVLSADGKHVVYPAGKGVAYDNKWFDTQLPPDRPVALSPDGTRWAARVGKEGSQRVFVDGTAGKEYHAVSEGFPRRDVADRVTTPPIIAFSPDGKQVAYAAVIRYEDEKKQTRYARVMVKDGAEQPRFAWVSSTRAFSPDGRRLAYLSADSEDGEWHVTVDGVRVGKGYGGVPAFSPDSKSIGLLGKRPGDVFAVLDNQEQKAYDAVGPEGTRVGFTPDGRYTFIGVREGAYYWVEARRK